MTKIFDIILFHYPCYDGLASAWIADMYHKLHNNTIVLYPIQHGTPIDLNQLKNKKVIFCDYSPSLETLEEIEKIATKILILDHHISAQRVLENKPYATFDMKRSGAGLTWNYFFPNLKCPQFIRHIEDRDLWTWFLPDSKNMTAGLYDEMSKIDSNNFVELFKVFDRTETNIMYYIKLGEKINKIKDEKIKAIINNNILSDDIIIYKGYKMRLLECPYDLASDLGSYMTSDGVLDFVALIVGNEIIDNTMYYKISLRANNKVDVSIIAKEYGGGGHKNAAGIKVSYIPFT